MTRPTIIFSYLLESRLLGRHLEPRHRASWRHPSSTEKNGAQRSGHGLLAEVGTRQEFPPAGQAKDGLLLHVGRHQHSFPENIKQIPSPKTIVFVCVYMNLHYMCIGSIRAQELLLCASFSRRVNLLNTSATTYSSVIARRHSNYTLKSSTNTCELMNTCARLATTATNKIMSS